MQVLKGEASTKVQKVQPEVEQFNSSLFKSMINNSEFNSTCANAKHSKMFVNEQGPKMKFRNESDEIKHDKIAQSRYMDKQKVL